MRPLFTRPSAGTTQQRRSSGQRLQAARRWLAPLGLAAGLSLAPMVASASFVYTYISNTFTQTTGTGLTSSDRIVFEFETANALGTGVHFLDPLSWRFTAGAMSFGSADSGATLMLSSLGPLYLNLDSNGLDSICTYGQRAGTGSFLLNNGRSPGSMLTGTSCANIFDNFDNVSVSLPSASTGFTNGFSSFTNREVVQQPPATHDLPEPATLALAGLALLAATGGRLTASRRR